MIAGREANGEWERMKSDYPQLDRYYREIFFEDVKAYAAGRPLPKIALPPYRRQGGLYVEQLRNVEANLQANGDVKITTETHKVTGETNQRILETALTRLEVPFDVVEGNPNSLVITEENAAALPKMILDALQAEKGWRSSFENRHLYDKVNRPRTR